MNNDRLIASLVKQIKDRSREYERKCEEANTVTDKFEYLTRSAGLDEAALIVLNAIED